MNEHIQKKLPSLFLWLFLLLTLCITTGCMVEQKAATNEEAYTIVDGFGESVTLPHKPMRIIGTSSSVDTMLLAVVEPNRVVAITDATRDPAISYVADEVKEIPLTIPLAGISMETLTKANPDLIVATNYTKPKEMELFKELGYPVIRLKGPVSIGEVQEDIRILAAATQEEKRGEKTIAEMNRHLQEIDDTLAKTPTPQPVALLVSQMSRYGGPGSMFHELLTRAHITSAFEKAGIANGQVFSLERIVQIDPDFFIVSTDRSSDTTGAGKYRDTFLANPAIAQLRAAKNIKPLQDRYIYAASQNCVYAIKAMANAAYGPLFDLSEEKQIRGY